MFLLSRFPCEEVPESKQGQCEKIKLMDVLTAWRFLAPCLALFFYVFAETGAAAFINIYLQKYYGAPPRWSIFAIGLFWFFMVLGRIICAFVPERVSLKKMIAVLSFAASGLFALQFFLNTWQMSIVVFSLLGFCLSGIWPLIINLATLLNHRATAAVVGITVAAGALGCIAAPAVLAYLFSVMSMPVVWVLLGIPMLLCSIVIVTVPTRA